jgi:hypothetical protein
MVIRVGLVRIGIVVDTYYNVHPQLFQGQVIQSLHLKLDSLHLNLNALFATTESEDTMIMDILE